MSETMALMKNKKLFILSAIIIVVFLLLGWLCLVLSSGIATDTGRYNTVADRAYSWRTGGWIPGGLISKDQVDDKCTVYIQESGGFEPYLALTAYYGGNVLLLRKYLLPELMPFNENESHLWNWEQFGAYYEDSTIDKYLNTAFINTLSQAVRDAVVDSDIIITDKSSWYFGRWDYSGIKTRTILRKAFLLSLKELSGPALSTVAPEGKPLKYFKDDYRRRAADFPYGEKCSYWTRTPEIWDTYIVIFINNYGVGSETADIHKGIRPAFCLKKTTTITQRTDIISGQTVYAVE